MAGPFAGWDGQVLLCPSSAARTGLVGVQVGSTKIYQVNTNPQNRRDWDHTQAIVVYDDGVDRTTEVAEVYWLAGAVRFKDSYTIVGDVTIDAYDLVPAAAWEVTSYSFSSTREALDSSVIDSDVGYRKRILGMKDLSLQLTVLDEDVNKDLDSGGGVVQLYQDYLDAGTTAVVHIRIGSTTDNNDYPALLMAVQLNQFEMSASESGLFEMNLSFEMNGAKDSGGLGQASFYYPGMTTEALF